MFSFLQDTPFSFLTPPPPHHVPTTSLILLFTLQIKHLVDIEAVPEPEEFFPPESMEALRSVNKPRTDTASSLPSPSSSQSPETNEK